MVEFSIKVNEKQRLAYIPKEIVRIFGLQLCLLPDAAAAIVYSTNTNLEIVIRSVEILLDDLKLRHSISGSMKRVDVKNEERNVSEGASREK